MQARWIQLPLDPRPRHVRRHAARPRPRGTPRFRHARVLLRSRDRPRVRGCSSSGAALRRAALQPRRTEEELDEILERLDAEEREREEPGLVGFEALEIRRLSPAELAQIERSERKRLQR